MIVTAGYGSNCIVTKGYGWAREEPGIPPPAYIGGGGGWIVPDLRKRERERRREILEDDQELMEMLMAIMPILN